MSLRRLGAVGLALLLAPLFGCGDGADSAQAPDAGGDSALQLSACEEGSPAQCGTLIVFEDRNARSGRRIPINVVVHPATGESPAPDPIFFFAGGPGQNVASLPAKAFENLNERRDIVLVDQRGTGKSHPLACPEQFAFDPARMLEPMLAVEDVKACREALEKNADLAHYTTANFVDDVDDVRAALGYEQINVYGGSYGTRPVQVYLRRHPEQVRSAVMHGVVRMDDKYPLGAPFAGQQALERMAQACRADAACVQTWGDPGEHLDKLVARLDAAPVEVEHEGTKGTLTREVALEGMRHIMYGAHGTVQLPKMLKEAVVDENYSTLVAAIAGFQSAFNEGENWYSGLWLSISCNEDVPWISEQDLERAEATPLGAYRPRVHVQACKHWARGELPADFHAPVQSDAPVLVLSGAYDPATTPQAGDFVSAQMPESLHVIAQEGHGATDFACTDKVVVDFFESGTTEALDVSCLEAVKLPPWPKAVEADAKRASG